MSKSVLNEEFIKALNKASEELQAEARFGTSGSFELRLSSADLVDECQRVFFRLTSKPDGSLVPLWDLLDDWPRFVSFQYGEDYRDLKRAVHRVIKLVLARACEISAPPVSYDPLTAVFTKTSETFFMIQELNRAFEAWHSSKKQ